MFVRLSISSLSKSRFRRSAFLIKLILT